MDYVKNLQDARARAWEEGKALLDGAAAEKREFTAEEQAKWEAINSDIDSKDEQIRDLLERNERAQEAEEARSEWARIVAPEKTERAEQSFADELRSFLVGEGPRYMDFDIRGVAREKQALRAGARGDDFRVLQEDVAAAGGSTVPTTFVRQLYDFIEIYSGVRRTRARVITTTSGENMTFPKVSLHGTAALVGEGTAFAANDPQFGTMTLGAWKYGKLLQLSNEVITDTGVDLLGFIAEDCGRAIGRVTDTAYLSGSGSGQPQGILPLLGTGVTSQTAATGLPSFANLIDLVFSVNEEYRRVGEFLMKDASAGALRKIVDTTNRPLWEMSYQVGQPDRLLGYPVFTDPNMAGFATAATTAKPIVFGDWSAFYIRDVGSVRLERSDDFAFDKDLVTWRCALRTDSDLIDNTAIKALANPST